MVAGARKGAVSLPTTAIAVLLVLLLISLLAAAAASVFNRLQPSVPSGTLMMARWARCVTRVSSSI